jgi:multicomponent K+:H+ antiporter subunit F
MITYALIFAMGCFGIGLILTFARALHAPTMGDRVLAVDTMVVNVTALVVLGGIQFRSGINFELAILLAMTGFVSSVAFCKFLLRGNIIE